MIGLARCALELALLVAAACLRLALAPHRFTCTAREVLGEMRLELGTLAAVAVIELEGIGERRRGRRCYPESRP